MNVHFIAIGGSAMHNLAIALYKKGYRISGSDDELFEPSRSRLQQYDLLPDKTGWDPGKIHSGLDAVILGMHARADNPELKKAKELRIKVYSYPEFIYNQVKHKKRVVIGGSHGKTTITAMIMHVLNFHRYEFDYLVGSQIKGFDTMVGLSNQSQIAVLEGDEYLSSAIDKRPKFHLYHPHIAVITGIHWDHINVFPSFELYVQQFREFMELIEFRGALVYYRHDKLISRIFPEEREDIYYWTYEKHPGILKDGITYLDAGNRTVPIKIFGEHNLENLAAAQKVCRLLGIGEEEFYSAIGSFEGAAKRLELIAAFDGSKVFIDYAHSPTKLRATIHAVREQFPDKKLLACMELHTFSSLNKHYLKEYKDSMQEADEKAVFFNPETLRHKKLEAIDKTYIQESFNDKEIQVLSSGGELKSYLQQLTYDNKVFLFMSSGNFSGLDLKELLGR